MVTLVTTKQDCLKKLLKTVRTTRRISELVRQRVPDHRPGDRKRPTAICVETTARYDELVMVCFPRCPVYCPAKLLPHLPKTIEFYLYIQVPNITSKM